MSDWENFDNDKQEEKPDLSRPNVDAEDFLKEPEVNYVRSTETLIRIGDDIGLTNKDPTLKKLVVGAGWNARSLEGNPPDLDISCFLLDRTENTRMDEDFIFYNNMQSTEGEVQHKGDSRAGAGEGDDENIIIDLQALSFDVLKIIFVLSIHEGEFYGHTFKQVRNCFFRLENAENNEELCRLEIEDEYMNEAKGVAMTIGTLFRDGPKWRFHATCEPVEEGGLATSARKYGLLVPQ